MKLRKRLVFIALCVVICIGNYFPHLSSAAEFQAVAIYIVVPGKHVEFLEWVAAWDEVFGESGSNSPSGTG
jgi:hypothetical protein